MKKLFLIVAAVALMLVGCKKQSELNFTDMGEATVLVNVVYNPGQHDVNGVLIEGEIPVTDAVVLAKIQYSEYSDPAQGAKEIEAENKGEGNYEVKVPAGQKPVNIEIIVRDYAAPYYENKDYAVNAMWTADPVGVGGLMKDYVKAVNVTMYKYENIANDAMTKELTVEGITKAQIEKLVFVDDEDPSLSESNIAGLEIKYAPMGCEFEMVLNNYNDDRTITYTFTSDAATGAFNQTVKYYDAWDVEDIYVEIYPKAFVGDFTHRYFLYNQVEEEYRAVTQTLHGYYENQGGATEYATIGSGLLTLNFGDIHLYFHAENEDIIRGAYDTGDVIDGHDEYKIIYGGLWN